MDIFMLLSCEELVKIMAVRFYLTVTSARPPAHRGEAMSQPDVLIDGVGLTCAEVRRVAQDGVQVRVDAAGLRRAADAHAMVKSLAAKGPVYGRTTGVGAN